MPDHSNSSIDSLLRSVDEQAGSIADENQAFMQSQLTLAGHVAGISLSTLEGVRAFNPDLPAATSQGMLECIHDLQQLSCSICGLDEASLVSLNVAQATFACLSMIEKYHQRKKQKRSTLLVCVELPALIDAASEFNKQLKTVAFEQLEESLDSEVAAIVLPINALAEDETLTESLLTRIRDLDILIFRDGGGQYALPTQFDTNNLVADLVHMDLAHLCETGPACHAIIAGEKLKLFLPVPLVQQVDNQFRLQTQFQNPLSIGSLNTSAGNIEAIIRCYVQFRLKGVSGIQQQSIKAIVSALYTLKKITEAGIGKDCSSLLSSGECSVAFTYSSVSIESLQQQLESFCLSGLKIVGINRKDDDRFKLTFGRLHYLTKEQLDSFVELILNLQ